MSQTVLYKMSPKVKPLELINRQRKGGQKQKTPSKKADSSSQSVMEKEATLSRLQSQTPQTSLFAATNFEGLDFSAFDDDE